MTKAVYERVRERIKLGLHFGIRCVPQCNVSTQCAASEVGLDIACTIKANKQVWVGGRCVA